MESAGPRNFRPRSEFRWIGDLALRDRGRFTHPSRFWTASVGRRTYCFKFGRPRPRNGRLIGMAALLALTPIGP